MTAKGDLMKPAAFAALAVLALLVTAPCHAQVYKWVDERGVTNYSSEPPADPRTKTKVKTVEDTLSVYTPPRAVTQAIEDARDRRNNPLAGKVDDLERELAAERRARQNAAIAAAEAQAAAGSGPTGVTSDTWYPPGAVFLPHARHRVIPQAQLKPGTTAGNVVGPGGYIPGNSAGARAPAPRPPAPSRLMPVDPPR